MRSYRLITFFILALLTLTSARIQGQQKKDSAVPYIGFVVSIETKDGNIVYESIRGVGNMEALRRYTKHTEEEKSLKDIVQELAVKAAGQALDMDRAQNTSILGSDASIVFSDTTTGVFIHEMLGHPSEADIILENKRDKTAELNLKSRIGGTVIENTSFNMVDSSEMNFNLGEYSLRNAWGSIPFDDHGTSKKTTNIVTRGVFTNPLTDRYTFKEVAEGLSSDIKDNIESHGLTCNSRTPDYKHVTQVRMTNTYLDPDEKGPKSVEEMAGLISKNKKGVYLKSCAGGWVNPDSGEFCIKGNLGYLIENGVITDKPIKDITIMGNIAKVGNNIRSIGASSTIKKSFTGYCGKRSEKDSDTAWVPTEGAGPAILVDSMQIGSLSSSRWLKLSKEYIKQNLEINNRQRRIEEYHLTGIDDIVNISDHSRICAIFNYTIEDEIILLTNGLKDLTTFKLNDKGNVVSSTSKFE